MHLSKHPAGWGVVILFVPRGESEARARKIAEMFGPVVLDKHHFAYLGATVGTNINEPFFPASIFHFIICNHISYIFF